MFSLKNEKNWVKLSLLLLIAATLAANLYAIFSYGNYFFLGSFEKMNNDDVRYIRTATLLLEKGMLIDNDINLPTVAEMPGHAVLLAGFIKLFGPDNGIVAFRVFQAALQAVCMLLLFLICREVFNRPVGLLACLADALYVPEISTVGLVLTEIEFKFFLLLLVYVSIFAIKTRQVKYYFAGGLLWGLTCLFRPTIALFPAVILIPWLLCRYSFRELAKCALIATVAFSLVLSPWWIRNYITFHQFIPLTLASGNPLLQGTYIDYDQSIDFVPYNAQSNAIKTNDVETEIAKYRIKKNFQAHPLKYLRWYTLGKTWHMWRYPFYWKQVFGIPFIFVEKYHRFLLVAGLVGMLACIRRKNPGGILLLLTVLYFNLVHLPYFTFSRYAYPVMPLFIALSVYGLKWLVCKALDCTRISHKYIQQA